MPFVSHGDVRLHYVIEGRGQPLLLVHGVGARLENWDGVAVRLAERFRIVRFDLRGHGGSSRVAGPYSLGMLKADVIALLDHLGIARCHVAGHSLGGLIAQELALGNPERIARLAFLSTACGRSAEEKTKVLARVDLIAGGIAGDHFANSVARWFTDEFRAANAGLIAAYAARNAENDPACYAAAYRVLATSDLADEIAGITAPTLIVTGEGDLGSNPDMARLMHARIAGSVLHILPRLRHSILIEAPETVAGLLAAFFSEMEPAPARP